MCHPSPHPLPPPPPKPTLFPYTTLFRSVTGYRLQPQFLDRIEFGAAVLSPHDSNGLQVFPLLVSLGMLPRTIGLANVIVQRSEEHTSELQSQSNLVCRLLLEKKHSTHVT